MDLYCALVGPGFYDFTRVKVNGWVLNINVKTLSTGWEIWDAPEGGKRLSYGELPHILHPGDTLNLHL
jgi:hypothetical protein